MRKMLFVALAAAMACCLLAVPASALNLPVTAPQPFKATFDDFSALWTPTPGGGPYTPIGPRGGPPAITAAVGTGEQRTIFRVNSLQDSLNNFDNYYNPATEELTGVFYDLKLVAATPILGSTTHFVLDFAPLGRNPLTTDVFKRDVATLPGGGAGGVGELYLGSGATKNFTANPAGDPFTGSSGLPAAPSNGFLSPLNGPAQWVEGNPPAGHAASAGPGAGGADAFPTVTDGTKMLAFKLLPLSYAVSQGLGILDPFVPLAPGTVLREEIDNALGVGSGNAYANVGFAAGEFSKLAGDFDGIPFLDLTLRFNLRALIFNPATGQMLPNPDYVGPGEWAIESQDPVRFNVVPEPATLALLGLGLAGIGGLRRRK